MQTLLLYLLFSFYLVTHDALTYLATLTITTGHTTLTDTTIISSFGHLHSLIPAALVAARAF